MQPPSQETKEAAARVYEVRACGAQLAFAHLSACDRRLKLWMVSADLTPRLHGSAGCPFLMSRRCGGCCRGSWTPVTWGSRSKGSCDGAVKAGEKAWGGVEQTDPQGASGRTTRAHTLKHDRWTMKFGIGTALHAVGLVCVPLPCILTDGLARSSCLTSWSRTDRRHGSGGKRTGSSSSSRREASSVEGLKSQAAARRPRTNGTQIDG